MVNRNGRGSARRVGPHQMRSHDARAHSLGRSDGLGRRNYGHRPITSLGRGRQVGRANALQARRRQHAGLALARPPEEPPSEERYHVGGRSPGSRVNTSAPTFPAPVQGASGTKWNRRSPLTVAGAAPDSAARRHRLPVLAPSPCLERGTSTPCNRQDRDAPVNPTYKEIFICILAKVRPRGVRHVGAMRPHRRRACQSRSRAALAISGARWYRAANRHIRKTPADRTARAWKSRSCARHRRPCAN